MGNDGGTIAKRLDIVSLHSSGRRKGPCELKGDLTTSTELCRLLGVHLPNIPVVSDYRGHLYSKEKLLEALLEHITKKCTMPSRVAHISRTDDLLDVTLTWSKDERGSDFEQIRLICPVTGDTRSTQLAYSRACGCVVSYKLLKDFGLETAEIGSCPRCTRSYDIRSDVVLLNPTNVASVSEINCGSYRRLQKLGLNHNKKKRLKRLREARIEAGNAVKKRRGSETLAPCMQQHASEKKQKKRKPSEGLDLKDLPANGVTSFKVYSHVQ